MRLGGRRVERLLKLPLLCLLVGVAAWPLFVLAATLLGLWTGEARQLDAWTLEPKRRLLADFLEGWWSSLPVAATLGLVAVVDYLTLGRYRVTWAFAGITLPIACAALALALGADAATALPALVATGVALAVLYRLAEHLWRRAGRV